jgi:hypothetical protein
MIKKILTISLFSSFLFAENISLTGETVSSLGNPYRTVFGEKNKSIKIFSEHKEIILKVDSNFNGPKEKEMILENKTVLNILNQFYGEEYKILIDKNSNISLNVLSGNVSLDYVNFDNNLQSLKEVVVTLNIELIINGTKINKTVSLDQTLGESNKNYRGYITTEDKLDLSIMSVKEIVTKIIEKEIINILKETK